MKNKILILIISFLVCSYVYWEDMNFSKSDSLGYVPWEVIVKYKDSNQTKSRSAKWNSLSLFSDDLESKGLEIKESFSNLDNLALVEIKDDKSVEDVVKMLNNDPNVEYAEPNYIRYLFSNNESVSTNDPYKSQQWALEFIDWPEAYNVYSWVLSKTSVTVAVVDNWVNYNHFDLSGSMWNPSSCMVNGKNSECVHWYDFYHNTNTPLPNYWKDWWHWTHVAGIIGAWINNWGMIWVNPYAKIASLKIWRGKQLSISDEIKAINFAIDNNIKIINASFWATWYVSLGERLAIRNFWNNWWLFIVAAGNNYMNVDLEDLVFPCSYDLDNIICVASIDESWAVSSFSNYWNISVDIAAPWSSIYSTYSSGIQNTSLFYTQNFNSCPNVGWWNYSGCYLWSWTSSDYGLKFYNSLKSPNIDLSSYVNKDLYISFSAYGCTNDVSSFNIKYSDNWWSSFWDVEDFNHALFIPKKYYTSNFSFELDIIAWNWWFCVIDDVSIYEDYYVQDEDGYGYLGWTSMATPHVVWLASLVWAISPELSYTGVKNLIMQNGSDLDSLTWNTVSWKVINVKKTLDAAAKRNIPDVEWLQSSWTGTISWNALNWVSKYYFEVLSWDNIIRTWFVENKTSTWLNITWDYTWRVQWLDELWNKSDFSTGYICSKPILSKENLVWIFSWYECSTVVWDLNYNDICSNSYEIVWSDGTWAFTLSWVWTFAKSVLIKNWFWEETDQLTVYYTWLDSLPTVNTKLYNYTQSITSASQKTIWNVVSLLWVNDWACGGNSIAAISVVCSQWQATLSSNSLSVTAPSNKQWTSECIITFGDNENNQITWSVTYSFNTVKTQTNNWWGWGGWWWGWWWGWWSDTSYSCKNLPDNAVANNKSTPKSNTNYSYSTDTSKVCTFQCKSGYVRNEKNDTCDKVDENKKDDTWETEELIFEKPKNLELFDNNVTNNIFDFSRFNNQNPTSVLLNWYTVEFNNAYEFAHRAWITTIDSIEKANMNWNLTRIAMAKMLSNYAINVLWKVPSNSIVPNFPDVSSKMNEDYWWAVTLSYQLWIMWKWINKFRPNDIVSRAEFGTALSRMLYWTQDWSWKYYSTHLDKLYKEWVISNKNPDLKELRWYVMIMLMRSAKN